MGAAPDPLRRVGVLGDIHAEHEALSASLGYLREHHVEAVLAVGDIVDGPGDPDRSCELLRTEGVLAVRGNHDRWFLAGERRDRPGATQVLTPENRRFLEALPATRELSTVAGKMMLCHGIGDDDMAALEPATRGYSLQAIPTLRELMLRRDLALVIGGHTHQRMVRGFAELTVINAGTLLRGHDPGFVVADFESRRVEFFDLPEAGAVRPVAAFDLPL